MAAAWRGFQFTTLTRSITRLIERVLLCASKELPWSFLFGGLRRIKALAPVDWLWRIFGEASVGLR
jgi:hypothetical protein